MAEDTYEVDQIIGRRTTSNGKEDYLVSWQSYSPILSTWEPINNFADCHRAIREFYDKHWPIPGTQATGVVHIAEKVVAVKQELLTLPALHAKKGKKLLKGLRQDLKEEILRLEFEAKSSSEGSVVSDILPPVTLRNSLNQNSMNQNSMMKFNGTSARNYGNLGTKKVGMKRKKQVVDSESESPHRSPEKISRRITPKYLSSVKKSLRSNTKDLKRRRLRPVNSISSSEGQTLMMEQERITVPSRLTRKNLPSCSTTCMLEEEIVVTNVNGCMYIKLCNEAKKNVVNLQMCEDIISSLHNAGKDDVSLVVISGSGNTFCYGWDLDQFKEISQAKRKNLLQKYRLMTRMLITCPKPLIAAVNGPAAGFGVALAGLCDLVLAGSKATFQTKFAEWGHPPVGCCSHTLPHLVGSAKAISMILLNSKLSALAAEQCGLVTKILETEHFDQELEFNVQRLLSVPIQCLQDTKSLLHENKVQELANANREESDFLLKYIISDTTLNDILKRWKRSIEE